MNVNKLLLPALAVGTGLILTRKLLATAGSAKPVRDGARYDAIDAYIERQMRRLNIPGASLAIVECDRIVHQRGFGRARSHGEAPSPQTPFFIGSLTKSFTALAIMQLVEAGQVELDAPVQRYLPWFRVAQPQASAQMTVRHLLNQTSGLPVAPGWVPLGDFDSRPGATERQARALASLKLTRPVGSAFEYSNMNYNLLGLIIEAASGESYADYIQQRVFIPLGMSHSYASQAAAQQNGLALGHQYWFAHPFAARNMPSPRGSLPSGQLISSSEDMARYLVAHLNEGRDGDRQVLAPAGIAELHHGVAEHNQMGVSVGRYGMGWYVTDTGQMKTIWHAGSVPDFSSFMALVPEQHKGVVLLVNAGHFMMTPILTEVGLGIASLLADQQPAPIRLGFIPWMMRALLLIPLLQIIDVAATLRLLRCARQGPPRRPSPGRQSGPYSLLPLIAHLSVALTLVPLLGAMRGFVMFFMPDFAGIATVCGSFSLAWSFLRTGLVLRALRKASPFLL